MKRSLTRSSNRSIRGRRPLAECVPDGRSGDSRPGIDGKRGSRVAALAEGFAAQTKHLHGLTKTWTKALRATAWLVGSGVAQELDSRKGQKLFTRVIESLAGAQGPIVRAAMEGVFEPELGELALLPTTKRDSARCLVARIAAIVRIAEALHAGRCRDSRIVAVCEEGGGLAVEICGGSDARRNADGVLRAAGLWNRLVLRPVVALRVVKETQKRVAADHGEAVAEAGRRILLRQLEQLLCRQYGLAYADDVEFVHEMRVATRRFRAAARIFRKAFEGRLEVPAQQLRELADVLGEARDADVFLGFLRDYRRRQATAQDAPLAQLIRVQERRRAAAYRRLLRICLAEEHQKRLTTLRRQFAAALGSPQGLQITSRGRTRTAAQRAQKALRRTMKTVLDFGPHWRSLSSEEQHRLRIACKKLRYTAEFFAQQFPPRLQELLKPVVRLQDLLGNAHDAEVYGQRLAAYFKELGVSKSCGSKRKQKKSAKPAKASARSAKARACKADLRAWAALRGHLRRRRQGDLRQAGAVWQEFRTARVQQEFLALVKAPQGL